MPRIAHIVESFENQAVENWLLRSYNELDKLNLIVMKDVYYISTKSKESHDACVYNNEFINFSGSKIKFLFSLYRYLREQKIEVLYSHHDITSGFYFLIKLFLPIKTVMHVHNCSLVNPFNNSNFSFRMKAFFLWVLNYILTDKVVCISNEVEKSMRKYFFFKKSIILNYYYHPVNYDIAETAIAESKKGLCFIGRLVPEKNPIRILQIFKEVLILNSSITLDIYGDGVEKALMIEFAIKENLISNVFFHGWTKDSDAAFQRHKLFLFPRFESPKEGLGLVFLESQYNKTIVLTSNCFSSEVKISNIFFSLPLGCSDKAWASTIIDLIQNDCESFMFNEKKSFFSNSYLIKQLSYYNGKLL